MDKHEAGYEHLANTLVLTVLSPLDLSTNPVAVAGLLAQWSDRMAPEQTTR